MGCQKQHPIYCCGSFDFVHVLSNPSLKNWQIRPINLSEMMPGMPYAQAGSSVYAFHTNHAARSFKSLPAACSYLVPQSAIDKRSSITLDCGQKTPKQRRPHCGLAQGRVCTVGVFVVASRGDVVVTGWDFAGDVGVGEPARHRFQPVGRVPVVIFDERDQPGFDVLQGDGHVAAEVLQWVGLGAEDQVLLTPGAVGWRLAAVSDDPLDGASISLPGHPTFAELECLGPVGRAGDQRQVGHSVSLAQ